MKTRILSLLAGAVCLILGAAGTDGNFSPWDAWRQGTKSFESGQQARERADYVQALDSFRQAETHFRQVQAARPDWNQNFISDKIKQCHEEITALNRLLGRPGGASRSDPEAPPSASGSGDGIMAGSRNELLRLQTEVEQYRNRLLETMTENENLRRQATRAQVIGTELENLMRERRELLEKNQQLQRELEQKTAVPDAELAAVRKQAVELKINAELLARKVELAQAESARQESEYAALVRQRNALQQDLNKAVKAAEASAFELSTLRQIRDQVVKDKNHWAAREKELQDAQDRTRRLAEARQQEVEALNRRLKEAAGKSETVNTELLEENERLRTERAVAADELAKALETQVELQNELRQIRTELTGVRAALQRVDDHRTQAENENQLLRTRLEKQLAAEELAGTELKNLREQNLKLSSDVRILSDRLEKSEERLNSRRSADVGAVAALNSENDKLRKELDSLKIEQKDVKTQLSVAVNAQKQLEEQLLADRAEQEKREIRLQAAERQQKEAERVSADYDRLAAEQKTLQQNFNALTAQYRELQKKMQEAAAAGDPAELRKALAEEQRRNQELLNENARLQHGGAVRPETAAGPLPPETMTPEKLSELRQAARAAEQKGEREVAAWNYRAILAARPADFDANRSLGELLLRDGGFAAAANHLLQAHSARPEDQEALLLYADAQIELAQYGNALALLEKAAPAEKQTAGYLLALGRALAGSGQAAEAENAFKAAETLRPADPVPLLHLARLLKDSRPETAAEYYDRAQQAGARPDPGLDPVLGKKLNERRELIEFLSAAAQEAMKHGDYASAAWYYAQLREQDPDSADYAVRHGFCLLLQNQPEAAGQALAGSPESPLSLLLAALSQEAVGKQPEARATAARAIKLNDDRPLRLPAEFAVLKEKIAGIADEKTRRALTGAIAP